MSIYEDIFNNVPLCIWEEDWTGVKKMLDEIRPTVKPEELSEYLNTHPGFVEKLINAIIILRVNQRTVDLYEAQSKEELICSLRDTFVADSIHTFKNEIRSLYMGNTEFEEETVTQTLNGNLVYTIIYIKFPSEENAYKNVLVTMIDITPQKTKIRNTLQKNTEKYKQLIEATRAAYVILDPDGEILEANDMFGNLLGCVDKDQHLDGKNLRSLVDGTSMSDYDHAWKSVIQGRTVINLELSLTKDGIFKWVNANISLIENGEKKVFCLMTDITRRKMEEQKKMIEKERHKDSLKKHIMQLRSKINQIQHEEVEIA